MGKTALYAALRLLFPPECFHCRKSHGRLRAPLCETCASLLEVLPAGEGVVITFESLSPASSLIKRMKQGASPTLAPLLAAYMALQYAKSSLPLPDVITSVPTAFFRKWQMGGDVPANIALEVAKLLSRPFVPLLHRKRQQFRQELLSKEERLLLSPDEFEWKNRPLLRGKTILLIDDTIMTGTTFRCCAKHLWEAGPAKIIKMACVDQGYLT
jgi:ComF family protein